MTHTDPYRLDRFVRAQTTTYDRALDEITRGARESHWMWFIFPQIEGLGSSSTSMHYSIGSVDEARAYLAHPVLGPRLVACADSMLRHAGQSASHILGYPDDLKLRSCATLFSTVSEPGSVFHRILESFFAGQPDEATQQRLGAA